MAKELTLDDLTAEAGEAAAEAAAEGADQATGEWVADLVETLDKRGILEPLLFGPENVEKVREAQGLQDPGDVEESPDDAAGDPSDDAGGLDLDAEGIAAAGRAIMDQLGQDVTVAEVVEIAEANPALVNQQIQENL